MVSLEKLDMCCAWSHCRFQYLTNTTTRFRFLWCKSMLLYAVSALLGWTSPLLLLYLFQENMLNLRYFRLGNGLKTRNTSEQASLLTHTVLAGHRQISGNHLGADHTPVTLSVSIRRGSDCMTSWLRRLCRVSWTSITVCTCLPFFPLSFFFLLSLMCSILQLHSDLSHGRIHLYSAVEILRWSATHDWELITWNLWGGASCQLILKLRCSTCRATLYSM